MVWYGNVQQISLKNILEQSHSNYNSPTRSRFSRISDLASPGSSGRTARSSGQAAVSSGRAPVSRWEIVHVVPQSKLHTDKCSSLLPSPPIPHLKHEWHMSLCLRILTWRLAFHVVVICQLAFHVAIMCPTLNTSFFLRTHSGVNKTQSA